MCAWERTIVCVSECLFVYLFDICMKESWFHVTFVFVHFFFYFRPLLSATMYISTMTCFLVVPLLPLSLSKATNTSCTTIGKFVVTRSRDKTDLSTFPSSENVEISEKKKNHFFFFTVSFLNLYNGYLFYTSCETFLLIPRKYSYYNYDWYWIIVYESI